MVSFIVPAHNEEAYLPRTLRAIHESAQAAGVEYEIVVANDASTDRTGEIARELGAHVVEVNNRQIAATRNSGARAANGDRFIFVDADTVINPRAVIAAVREMDKGAAGGGAVVRMDGTVPLWMRFVEAFAYIPSKLIGFCGGAFMYCARAAFYATGGFNEKMFWAEEGAFALALRREGPFVIVWPRVLTSSRRLRTVPARQLISVGRCLLFHPIKLVTDRESVREIWYNSDRSKDETTPNSVRYRIGNAITLLIVLSLVTSPILDFVPWSWTPRGTWIGNLRFANAVFLNHVGLFLWPVTALLAWCLLQQRIFREWLRMAAVLAFCLWQAWGATRGVIFIWTLLFQWAHP